MAKVNVETLIDELRKTIFAGLCNISLSTVKTLFYESLKRIKIWIR